MKNRKRITARFAALGMKGGATTGRSKKRGSKAYYRALQLKAAAARKANRAARAN